MLHPIKIGLKYPKIVWALTVALLLFSGVGIFRIEWVKDITALLPKNDDSMAVLAKQFGMMRSVAVVLESDHSSDGELHSAIEQLLTPLAEMDDVVQVIGRVDQDKAMKSAQLLMERSARLYTKKNPINASTAMERVALLKQRLASPEGMVMGPFLLKDPFGLANNALRGLESVGKAMGQVVEKGHVLSHDRRVGLIMFEVGFDPMDVDHSHRFVEQLDTLLTSHLKHVPHIRWTALGGVHHAALTAVHMKRDIAVTFLITIGLVLVIFLTFFGNFRMLPAALLPAGLGIVSALGIFGWIGVPLHALTLGFAATITGISIDYVIHLLYHAKSDKGNASSKIENALVSVWRPIVLGGATTLGAFILIAFSGFTGIRQLALFSVISLPIALLAALLLVPTFASFLLRSKQTSETMAARVLANLYRMGYERRPWQVIAFFFVLLAGLLVLALGTTLSGDPRDLGHRSSDISKREAVIRKAFPGVFDHVILDVFASDLDRALEKNDRLYERLSANGISMDKVVSISPFLPSLKKQAEAVDAVKSALPPETMRHVLVSAGFEDGFADSVIAELESSPLTQTLFSETSLSNLIDKAIHQTGNMFHVVTRVSGGDDALLFQLQDVAQVEGARVVSSRLEIMETLTQFQQELVVMLAIWLGAALLILSVVERSVWFGAVAALPAILGVLGALALFALMGRPLTPVASAGMTLVMGLGIDYGIFMQQKQAHLKQTASAVGASALTTLAAFGVLAISDVQAMSDIGMIILAGLICALATALFWVPSCRAVLKKQ